MFKLHQQFETEASSARELIDAQSRLGRAQGEATGLLISITRLRDLHQTVEIAAHNLREYQPPNVETAQSTHHRSPASSRWLTGSTGSSIESITRSHI